MKFSFALYGYYMDKLIIEAVTPNDSTQIFIRHFFIMQSVIFCTYTIPCLGIWSFCKTLSHWFSFQIFLSHFLTSKKSSHFPYCSYWLKKIFIHTSDLLVHKSLSNWFASKYLRKKWMKICVWGSVKNIWD